jgi:hypothetical protein
LYVWWVAGAGALDSPHILLLGDYVLFIGATLAISFSRRRGVRIVLTLLSATFGGIEGYMDLALFPVSYSGLLLFLWAAFGVLLMLASVSWMAEMSRTTRSQSAVSNG